MEQRYSPNPDLRKSAYFSVALRGNITGLLDGLRVTSPCSYPLYWSTMVSPVRMHWIYYSLPIRMSQLWFSGVLSLELPQFIDGTLILTQHWY